jgi:hypothetical protein
MQVEKSEALMGGESETTDAGEETARRFMERLVAPNEEKDHSSEDAWSLFLR